MHLKSLLKGLLIAVVLLVYTGFFSKIQASQDITSTWGTSINIPIQLASSALFSVNNKLILSGGANSLDFSNVWESVSNQGVLGSWGSTIFLSQTRYWAGYASKNSNLYLLGGASLNDSSTYLSSVLMGTVNLGGNLTGWTLQNPLPNNLGLGAAAISGNRIFFSGGFNSSTVSKKVYSVPINPDGSLGTWIEAGEMPEARYGHGMIEHNGYLIILGGSDNGSIFNTVYKASINTDGTISSWLPLPSLPEPLYRASFVKTGGQILAVGGYNDGSGSKDTVYYTTLHDDGAIDAWQLSSNHLPNTVHAAAATIAGGYLYLAGGFRTQTNEYLDSVYVTKLNISNDISLNVPLLKQTDPLWKDLEYDSAHLWAAPSAITIGRWGCALTSAVMVFRYHGITKLPDGTDLNPETLNAWLNGQHDSYFRNGLVNWNALAKLSKLSKSQNPGFSFDALQYKRDGTFSAQLLTQDLQSNIPDILEEPGHFIVAKGTLGNSFSINDPFYNKTSLADYSNTAISRRRFIPSHTDLSYITFVVDPSVEISLYDENNNQIGESYIENPISDPLGISNNIVGALKIIEFSEPTDGFYTVKVSSTNPQKYFLQGYLYDKDGEVKMVEQKDVLSQNDFDTFSFSFSKAGNESLDFQQSVTISTLKKDLDALYLLGYIKKEFYKELREKISEIEKNYGKGKSTPNKLKELLKEIKEEKKCDPYAVNVLKGDIVSLLRQF